MRLLEFPSGSFPADKPLAERLRPRSIDEIIGQDHVLGPGKLLRNIVGEDFPVSIIIFGPPGSGKTSFAKAVENTKKFRFISTSALESSVSQLKSIFAEATKLKETGKTTILFIDEIYRFSRTQQDHLLEALEKGTIKLIGTTTVNPRFHLSPPLLSRCMIFEFKRLKPEDIERILEKALNDERGLKGKIKKLEKDVLKKIALKSGGDARVALNMLETVWKLGKGNITLELVERFPQFVHYDRAEDMHYDTVSAFIKSIRGSDPDAAIYWLAKMLEGGEDPRFIARRLAIAASEDIGNADPLALLIAAATAFLVEFVGLPEAKIILAQAVTYLATAFKSNASYKAINEALKDIKEGLLLDVPEHLKTTSDQYLYPHDFGGYIEQTYMPVKKVYYKPVRIGAEERIRERMIAAKKQAIRQKMRLLYQRLPEEKFREMSKQLCENLWKFLQKVSAKRIWAFYPWRHEPDIKEFIINCLNAGITVGLPFIFEHGMKFLRVKNLTGLKPGLFGIPQPSESSPEVDNPELIFVPGLAFDRKGNRLGRGKGYYDQFLKKVKILKIGVCLHFQLLENLPFTSTDIKMDVVITDKEILKICV